MSRLDRRDKRKRFRVSDIVLDFDHGLIRSQSKTYINANNRKALLHVVRLAIEEELTGCQKEYAKQYYFDCLTMREIAQLHGVDIATVSHTLKRARNTLRKSLKYCVYIVSRLSDGGNDEDHEEDVWANAY